MFVNLSQVGKCTFLVQLPEVLRCTGKSSDLGPRISKWAKVLTNKHLHRCQPLGTPHFHILISVPETRYSPVASTIHLSPCRCSITQKTYSRWTGWGWRSRRRSWGGGFRACLWVIHTLGIQLWHQLLFCQDSLITCNTKHLLLSAQGSEIVSVCYRGDLNVLKLAYLLNLKP
jgi:hypothetical protein